MMQNGREKENNAFYNYSYYMFDISEFYHQKKSDITLLKYKFI